MEARGVRALPPGRTDCRRGSWRPGTLAYCLAVGVAATLMAAALSLVVDSAVAKRVVWLLVTLGVAVGAGIWRALTPVTGHRPGNARLPTDRPVSSHHGRRGAIR